MNLFDFEIIRANDVDRCRRIFLRRFDPRRTDDDPFGFERGRWCVLTAANCTEEPKRDDADAWVGHASRVWATVSRRRELFQRLFWRDAKTSARDARATRSNSTSNR